jgi:hypothetical protein
MKKIKGLRVYPPLSSSVAMVLLGLLNNYTTEWTSESAGQVIISQEEEK